MLFAIKTFANQDIGAGHVLRQEKISKELKRRGHTTLFMMKDYPESRILSRKFNLDNFIYSAELDSKKEAKLIIDMCRKEKSRILIVDNLNSDESFVDNVKKAGIKIVSFDDNSSCIWYSDLSVNALFHSASKRPKGNKTKLLLGFKYLIMEKSSSISSRKRLQKVKSLFVSQGGVDTYGTLPFLIKSLRNIPNSVSLQINVGPVFKHWPILHKVLSKTSANFSILENVNDLKKHMAKVDMAISACGMTIFELLSLGVPTIAITAEPREIQIQKKLSEAGVVFNLGFISKNKKGLFLSKKIETSTMWLANNITYRNRLSRNAVRLFGNSRGLDLICNQILRLTKT